MNVYRVYSTGGDNDDWIHGIFSTRALAEAFKAQYAAAHDEHPELLDIEEHILDRPSGCECWRKCGL